MKHAIKITGQISGNHKLRNACITAECTEERGMFYSVYLVFKSKKCAVKALSDARKYFAREMPDDRGLCGWNYLRGHALSYDASRAEIQPY